MATSLPSVAASREVLACPSSAACFLVNSTSLGGVTVSPFSVSISLPSPAGVKSQSLSFSNSVSSASPLPAARAGRDVVLVPSRPGRRRSSACWVSTLSTVESTEVQQQEKPDVEELVQTKPAKRGSGMRQLILKPPLSDTKLAERFMESPQLQLKTFPVLSSCLPLQALRKQDLEWMDEYLLEAKNALGYELGEGTEPRDDSPASHLDSLLFLAFNHQFTRLGRSKWVGIGHSRLWFLGQFVVELALCELFLQIYPRERVGPVRERVFNLTSKKVLPFFMRRASLDRLLFPTEELQSLKGYEKQAAYKDVFWALVAAMYLTLGMGEVYRFLFEVLGMDLEAPTAQPRERFNLPDCDLLSSDLENTLTWRDIVAYKVPDDSLSAHPLLFRAIVPTGMHRFRGNSWEVMSLSAVRETLGYPRNVPGSSAEVEDARNVELGLGLQLCFLHPSMFKGDHPRFCFDRLEYLGSKIKDVVGAEQLLMKHLDTPAKWLDTKHHTHFLNRICGRTLRAKKLHYHIIYSEERKEFFERNRRMRNFSTTSVQHAIHGLGYLVYGRSEVRRLINKVFPVDDIIHPKFL